MSLFPEFELKNYFTPPLPFMGNKAKMIEPLKRVLSTFKIAENVVFLDVFGGSGLISHHLKQWYPKNEVVYNDFDFYTQRLEKIELTNEILKEILKLDLSKYQNKIDDEKADEIKRILNKYDEKDIDFITFSACLKFSGNYYNDKESFFKSCFYNRLPKKIYGSKGYLKGVIIEHLDFEKLFLKYKVENTFLILDPPYLQTQSGNYKSHFTLKQFLKLFKFIKDRKNFILFASEKSDNLELLNFFEIKYQVIRRKLNLGNHSDLLIFCS